MSDYPRGSSENDSRALDRGGCRCFHGNPYENSLDEAVLYGEQEAQRYMQKSYAIRYLVVVVVFIAVSWLRIANVLTLFAGIMSLKLAAYLQPIMHKLFAKFKKSK